MDSYTRLSNIAIQQGVTLGPNHSVRIQCPVHYSTDKKGRNLHLFVNIKGQLIAQCHSNQCDYREVFRLLEGDHWIDNIDHEAIRQETGLQPSKPKEPISYFVNGWTKYIQAVYLDSQGQKRPSYRMDYPARYGKAGEPCGFIEDGEICGQTKIHKHIIQKGNLDDIHILLWEPSQESALSKKMGSPIIITEGEKDAKAVQAAGFISASYIGGANNADRADYQQVSGKNVIVWPDNDEQGRLAQAQVVHKIAGLAQNIAVIQTSGEDGSGAADLNSGGINAALRTAERINAEFEPIPETTRRGCPTYTDCPGPPAVLAIPTRNGDRPG